MLRFGAMKWLVRGVLVLVIAYVTLFSVVTVAMLQPPERFGQIIKYMPMPLVWGVLPGPRIWLWARKGSLKEGGPAPDFSLSTLDRSSRVTLSSHRGVRPVVLVFGSYT